MKCLQGFLIFCMATAVLSVIWGCATLGQDEIELRMDGEPREYPQVPDGYPFDVIWQRSEEEKAQIAPVIFENLVLLNRAMIKLWERGDRDFVGAHLSNEIFYPKYPDVVYVEWEEHEKPDGTIHKRISDVIATDGEIMKQIRNGETPPGIRIVDVEEAGIDINEFLSK